MDQVGRITWVNKSMLSLGGYSAQAYPKAGSFSEFIAPESRDLMLANFANFAAGRPYEHNCAFTFLRSDGEKRFCESYVTDYRDRHGGLNLVISITDITENKRAEEDHERLITAIQQAGEAILITNPDGAIQYVNPAFERISGYSRAEIAGKTPRILKSGTHDAEFYRGLWERISSGKTWESRIVNKRKDGTLYTEEANISPVKDAAGRIVNYVAVTKDITESLKLERQFHQAQKMESVGLLAGGVAHDFNNILTAIKGYCSMVTRALPPEDPCQADMVEIQGAADRAAALTKQLLAFSRRQILAPKVLDLNLALGGISKMLHRLIGENVKLAVKTFPEACTVKVDPGQMEQVVLNLVLNARDAVSGKGEIALETEIVHPGEEFFAAKPGLQRGRLVCVKVRDNGSGMSAEVKSHLFEPFLTTKEPGKGTGLGLAVVFGVVKQSAGEIEVDSAPGKGTVFKLYFPYQEETIAPKEAAPDAAPAGGRETLLFVEDEESLRRLGVRVLSGAGYTILGAADGSEALKLMERRGAPVDLVITDVVMPGLSGRELTLELERRKLTGRTLYMSGYTDDAITQHGVLDPGVAFIHKPFSPDALIQKVREVLDAPAVQPEP